MSTPTQAQQPNGQQGPYFSLIRLEQLEKLPLPADKKSQIQTTIANHWNMIRSKPRDSPEHMNAMRELQRFTNALQSMTQRSRVQNPQSQASTSASTVPMPQMQTNLQPPHTQAHAPAQTQQPQIQNHHQQQQQQQRPSQVQHTSGQKPDAPSAFSQPIRQHIEKFHFAYPPDAPEGTTAGEKWLNDKRQQYAALLQVLETAGNSIKAFEAQEKTFAAHGKQPTAQLLQQKAAAQASYIKIKTQVDQFRQNQAKLREKQQQDSLAGKSQATSSAQAPALPNNPAAQLSRAQIAGAQQNQAANVNAAQAEGVTNPAIDAARNLATARQSASPVSATQPQQQHSATGQAPTSFASQAARPAPQRPSMTTQQPAQAGTSNTAQPVPLTHGAAIDRSHSERSQATLSQQPNQSAVPNHFSTRTQTESHTQQRFPISKTLPVSVTQPLTPVSAGPIRPTMANGGASNQPIIAKQPTFTLEGDSKSRVLSKRKLDELVRQVTGSTLNLTPHAEETVMEMADEFVDNVVTAACRLAKLRNDSTLEIRDIQTVLERNYNIRIPGYSMDETRVVRRVNPAPGWNQKMNAISAAKVMNNTKPDA